SVISGAALYSAIQDAKVTAMISDMNEVGKAYDAYYLDVGSELAIVDSGVYIDIQKIVDDNSSNWKGPYSSLPKHSSISYGLDHPLYQAVYIGEMLNGSWTDNGAIATWATTTRCDTGTVGGSCDFWVVFQDVPMSIYEALDKKVDGSVDGQNGNVRLVSWSGIASHHVYLKYRPKQN
ncbi:MAG TPA: hypothetical protein DCL21_06500, partial [Alphaproteobacteria bacterium]|nr:hypothetical protein [Alphaproteobacteria bacterium]